MREWIFFALVSHFFVCEASPKFELIGENTWCQPSDHITSFMHSNNVITPESCERFCRDDEDAMSFMIREGSPHQCMCHGGPCLEMSQLIDDGVDAYRLTERVNQVCSDDEVFLFGKNGPSDSQCVLESVLQACFDDQCDTSSCCSDLVSCSTRNSCPFTAHSSTQCVQVCQDMYINNCDCSGGVSCGYVESMRQFGCLADCVKPNTTQLEEFNVASLVDCNEGQDTMQRETTCDVECKPLHVPESNGLIVCDALARITVDRCLEPCEVIVPQDAVMSCTGLVEHGTVCEFACANQGYSPSGDGELKCSNGIFETDEICVPDPCTDVSSHIDSLSAIENAETSRFGDVIEALGCSNVMSTSNTMESGDYCVVECEANHKPSVKYNDNPNMLLLKIGCLEGQIDDTAECVPDPCDISDFFVYNMKSLNCNFGSTSVDASGNVQGTGFLNFEETCVLSCDVGYVPSGDGILQCGKNFVGQLEYEFCQRYYVIDDDISADCDFQNGQVINTIANINTADECVDLCGTGCNSFRVLESGSCELWDTDCPDPSTRSSTDVGDFGIPSAGSCQVNALMESIEGIRQHTCGLSKISTGSSCTFDCKDGFTLRGGGNISCLNGDLSVDTACDPNDCPVPNIPFSDSVNCTDADGQPSQLQNSNTTTSGSSCAVKCSAGYHQRTDNTLDCYAGSVTPSMLYCDPDPCDTRSVAIARATDVGCFSVTDGTKVEQLEHQESCVYDCEFGYEPSHDGLLQCNLGVLQTETCVLTIDKISTNLENRSYVVNSLSETHSVRSLVDVSIPNVASCADLNFEMLTSFRSAPQTSSMSFGSGKVTLSTAELYECVENLDAGGVIFRISVTMSSSSVELSNRAYLTFEDHIKKQLLDSASVTTWAGSSIDLSSDTSWVEVQIDLNVSDPSSRSGENAHLALFETLTEIIGEQPTNFPIRDLNSTSTNHVSASYVWTQKRVRENGVTSVVASTTEPSIMRVERHVEENNIVVFGYNLGMISSPSILVDNAPCTSVISRTRFGSRVALVCEQNKPDGVGSVAQIKVNAHLGPVLKFDETHLGLMSTQRIETLGSTMEIQILNAPAENVSTVPITLEMIIYARHRNANSHICTPLSSSLDTAPCILQYSTMFADSLFRLTRTPSGKLSLNFNNVFMSGAVGSYRLSTNGVVLNIGSADSGDTVFEFKTNRPVVSSIEPESGYGGAVYTVRGRNFGGAFPEGCGEFVILLGTSECKVSGDDDDGNALGWKDDSEATCRATTGTVGRNAIQVIRTAQQSPTSVFLNYLGDVAPMSNEDLAMEVWAEVEVNVQIECPTTEEIVTETWNANNYTSVANLTTALATWRNGFCDVQSKVQIIPINFLYPTVLAVKNIGNLTFCDDESNDLEIKSCTPFGSDGEMALALHGEHFAEWNEENEEWVARVESIMIEQAFVSFDVVNSTYIEINLPPNTGSKNTIVLVDITGASDLNGKVTFKEPEINSIVGCSETDLEPNTNFRRTSGCPMHAGNDVRITISGKWFGDGGILSGGLASVFVGIKRCSELVHLQPQTDSNGELVEKVSCNLPGGPADNSWVAVFVLTKDQFSIPQSLVKYVPCVPGTYYDESLEICANCTGGSYTKTEGSRSCTETEMGYYSDNAATDQTPCPLGTYASTKAQSECDNCSPGFFTESVQSETCTPCDAGTFASEPGSRSCDLCPFGRFQASVGMQDCPPCPAGMYSATRDATTDIITSVNRDRCTSCESGTNCEDGIRNDCGCQSACFWPKRGYDCSSASTIEELPCPRGNKCRTSASPPVPCAANELCNEGTSEEPRICVDPNAVSVSRSMLKALINNQTTNNDTIISYENNTNTSVSQYDWDVMYSSGGSAEFTCGCVQGFFGVYGEITTLDRNVMEPPFGTRPNLKEEMQCTDLEVHDLDTDGFISQAELREVFELIWVSGYKDTKTLEATTDYDISSVIVREHAAADLDGDGTVTTDEFCEYYITSLWPSQSLLHCFECPIGAVCDRSAVTVFDIQVDVGYWQSPEHVFTTYEMGELGSNLMFKKCLGLGTGCSPVTASWDTCTDGNVDVMCSLCDNQGGSTFSPSYGMDENGQCMKCQQTGMATVYALCMYGGAIFLYATKAKIQAKLLAIAVYIIQKYFPDEGGESRAGRKSIREFEEEPSHALDLPELASEEDEEKKKMKNKPHHGLDLDLDDASNKPHHGLDLDLDDASEEVKPDDDNDFDKYKNASIESKESFSHTDDVDTKDASDSDDEQQGQDHDENSTMRRPRQKAPSPPKKGSQVIKNDDDDDDDDDDDEEDELELAVFSKDAVVQDKPLMSKLKGVIGVFQIIMVLKGDIEVSWPTMWSGFADSFSFLAVNPMALPLTACAWTFTFYQKFIIIMVGPIFIVCVITPTMFLITKHCKCCPRWWPEVRGSTLWQVSFFVPFIVYPICCQYIGKMFICDTLEDGIDYLVADYSQQCFKGQHMSMVTFALPFVFIYPLGVPLYFAWALNSFGAILYDPTGPRDQNGRAVVPLLKTKKKLGFLYATYAPHAAWFELVELFRKFFFTLAMIFVEPMYPNQLYAGMIACIGFSLLNAYIKPFTDVYSQLNAQFVDLALFFVMAGAISLKVSEDYPADEDAGSVDLVMTLTSILPIAFIVVSMFAELDATKHFVEDLTIKLRQLKYGIFGVNISKSDVIYDHFFGCCCRRRNKPVAKYPKLSVAICRPLQQMNTVIAKLVFSEERLNLLNKLVQRVIEFTYKIHKAGKSNWRHKLNKKLYRTVFKNADDDFGDELMHIASKNSKTDGDKKKKRQKFVLDSEIMKILGSNLVDAMVEYINSLEDIDDEDDVGVETFNRIRSLIRFINGLLTVALGKVSVSFGKVMSVSLEDVDEVTVRAIFEALQKVEDNIRMIGMIRAYKKAVKEEKKRLRKLNGKTKTSRAVVKPVSDDEEIEIDNVEKMKKKNRKMSATIEMSPVVSTPTEDEESDLHAGGDVLEEKEEEKHDDDDDGGNGNARRQNEVDEEKTKDSSDDELSDDEEGQDNSDIEGGADTWEDSLHDDFEM